MDKPDDYSTLMKHILIIISKIAINNEIEL